MMPKSDIRIKEELLRALKWDPRLSVAVSNGAVTLTGTVDSHVVRLLAQEEAQFIEGVFGVTNLITVDNPHGSWTDMELANAARTALEWDASIPHDCIQVAVSNGWVGLTGEVELLREREDAERLVRRLTGVRGVYNEIEVKSSQTRMENVRDAIEEELKRRASLEAGRIQISLRDGKVILTGPVQSWEEERAIVKAASRAPGVESISDCLCIER